MDDAFVDRDAGTQREDQQGDDETPEIDFTAVPHRVLGRRRRRSAMHAVQQQRLVAGIHQRMHAFAEHRRAAGDGSGHELGHGDQKIAGQRRVDDLARTAADAFASAHRNSFGPLRDSVAARRGQDRHQHSTRCPPRR